MQNGNGQHDCQNTLFCKLSAVSTPDGQWSALVSDALSADSQQDTKTAKGHHLCFTALTAVLRLQRQLIPFPVPVTDPSQQGLAVSGGESVRSSCATRVRS